MHSKIIFEKLTDIYQKLDEELSKFGLTCKCCGRCCDFGNFDFVLYVSRIEFDYIANNALITKPSSDKNRCPYLGSSGACIVHPYRALGCRTFFCRFPDKDAMQDIYNKYFNEIKKLQKENDAEWEYKPFLDFLKERSKDRNDSAVNRE